MDFAPVPEKKSESPAFTESDIEHEELYGQLKQWRTKQAKKQNVAAFQIMHQRVLIQIAVNLPGTPRDLQKIRGVGPKTFEKYGKEILALVLDYREKHHIKEVMLPQPNPTAQTANEAKKRVPETETRQMSSRPVSSAISL